MSSNFILLFCKVFFKIGIITLSHVPGGNVVSIKINEFAASSIDILVRCFANTNEYERFLEIKDNLAIEIKQIVEKRKASFAFPSQSIYVEKN